MTDEQTKPQDAPVETPVETVPEAPVVEVQEPVAVPTEEEIAQLPAEELGRESWATSLRPGMVVRVHETIKDLSPQGEERSRVQVFQGIILGMQGSTPEGKSITVRKVAKGFGVEKIFPLNVPTITKIEVIKQYKVRRAKLSFLRGIFKRGRMSKRFERKMKEIQKQG